MATTFSAVSIGQLTDIDTVDRNTTVENAEALVGMTFGGPGDPLLDGLVEWSAVGNPKEYYDTDGRPAEHFRIDGGNPQRFDSTASYNATITYTDGSTATVTVVLAQDTDGNAYLVPSASSAEDLEAWQSGPIRSITFDSVESNVSEGLTASQNPWTPMNCFLAGTRIETADGPRLIEGLVIGDMIPTVDNGMQPIRWIGTSTINGRPDAAPVCFEIGALGNTAPLYVSPQHRMLLTGWRAELYMGEDEVLIPAIQLVNDHSIRQVKQDKVTYYHLMFDTHELIYAEGIVSESFHPGQRAVGAMARDVQQELLAIFPQLADVTREGYGPSARPTTRSFEALMLY
tara:strand:- start:9288 stop:10319 length:1032 start_codon:yes stop_codon:yes gene_type:complete